MKILISDINQDCKTLCGKFICFLNKLEVIGGVKNKVYGVEIETGHRILNPDYKVEVNTDAAY